jgi:hypothetical protein
MSSAEWPGLTLGETVFIYNEKDYSISLKKCTFFSFNVHVFVQQDLIT